MSRKKRKNRGRKTLPPVGTFAQVVCPHPRKGSIVEVTEYLMDTLQGWAMVKFNDGYVGCLKASHLRRLGSPLKLLAGQGK